MQRPIRYRLEGHEIVPCDSANDASCDEWLSDLNNRRVASIDLSERVRVSTVFLGITSNFTDDGAPILFESMIFVDGRERDAARYCTWDEAEAGHNVMVIEAQQIMQTLTPRIEPPDGEV